jgi:hypothetical protein
MSWEYSDWPKETWTTYLDEFHLARIRRDDDAGFVGTITRWPFDQIVTRKDRNLRDLIRFLEDYSD